MVSRKPVGDNLVPKPLSQAVSNPPYPISPTDVHPPSLPPPPSTQPCNIPSHNNSESGTVPASTLDTVKQLRQPTDSNAAASDSEDDHEWDSDFEEIDADEAPKKHDLPATLKVGGATSPTPQTGGLPSTLRVGPPEGVPRKSLESLNRTPPPFEPSSYGASSNTSSQGPPLQSHNPYLNYQATGQSSVYSGDGNAQPVHTGVAATNPWASSSNAVELPSQRTPIEEVSKLSLGGNHGNTTDEIFGSSQHSTAVQDPKQDIPGKNSSPWDPGMDISSLDAFSSRNHRLAPMVENKEPLQGRTWQEQQDWDRKERERQQMELATAAERAQKRQAEQSAEDEWFRGEVAFNASSLNQQPSLLDDPVAPLPTRNGDAAPSRPNANTARQPSPRAEPETPGTRSQRQRKEHYQIKHVRWYDAKKQGVRPAPILTQNANGPCPLLALVNALVLSTPYGEETALIETLRTREQVSLGLLLDAVFDELMSGRRGDAAQQLPDVGELYSFLVTLHTGMNVNPRFVKAEDAQNRAPGGFETTKEMRMYSTFNIPLIHGWLPPSESRAYAAFERTAKTYEDAQNVQFHEEELEAKLQAQGLTPQEQDMFQDLQSIKDFLHTWPTQLTDHGLGVMTQNLKPGQVAILFRNDHFSTLYKEPRTGRIFTLVTDAGYSRHEEIVWETLVDVHGQGSELFSGDFRPVGNMSDTSAGNNRIEERPIRSLLDTDDEHAGSWTAVRNSRRSQANPPQSSAPITSSTAQPNAASVQAVSTEQEDHDLALALQLQEEEEDRHRRDLAARRRRENELSEQFISSNNGNGRNTNNPSNGQQVRPMIPPRRTHNNDSSGPAPATVQSNANDDAPPPTYEQAAAGRPYNPPRNHPASSHAPIQPARPVTTNQSAYAQSSGVGGRRRASGPGLVNQIPGGRMPGRRSSAGPSQLGQGHASVGEDREKCIVM